MNANFWEKIKKPVVVMAPMSGVTDEAFRLMLLGCGKPEVFWTEFVSADGLFSRGRDYCLDILKFDKRERPIVAQIFGADPDNFEKTAKEIANLGFDGIDINMGCPDKNIEKQGAGATLIKNPELAKQIIRAAKRGAGEIPVSVKTRIGYKESQILDWIPALLQERISALTVHFRTRDELYSSTAHWELAKEVVKLRDYYSPKTLILGNGDVKSLEEAIKLVKETGLDGIMIGRALLGNPWFFSGREPSEKERLEAIIKHAEIFEGLNKHNNWKFESFDSIKKHFHGYTKGLKGSRELREDLMKTKSVLDVRKVIESFAGCGKV